MLDAGKTVMVLSAGALLTLPDLITLAKERGGQIIVPTGALLGLDAVTAAAEGRIRSVRMVTRKPPNGLAGAPYLLANNVSVDNLREPKRVFSGTAREAAAGFPANVNVAAALSLAGIGPDRTLAEIWADPTIDRNCHTIEVDADSARFTLNIENIPSENPRTGRTLTALSVLGGAGHARCPLRSGPELWAPLAGSLRRNRQPRISVSATDGTRPGVAWTRCRPLSVPSNGCVEVF